MEKEELTDAQLQLFLQYGSIPAGYSKEEMEKLTKHSKPDSYENAAEFQNTKLVGKDWYRFCEICKRPIWGNAGSGVLGHSRIRRRRLYYPGDDRRIYAVYRYCYICHKSMCNRCMKGVVCKNCQEFFPEEVKVKNLSLIRKLLIIIISSFAIPTFSIIAIIAIVLLFPHIDLRIPISIFVILIWLSFISPFLAYYLITRKQLEFTMNFIENLNDNTELDQNVIKEVNAVYVDGNEHIENERKLTYCKSILWISIPFSILFFGWILYKLIAL